MFPEPFDVDDRSPAVEAMAQAWPMIDALTAGTAAMRRGGRAFLPKWPNESDASYTTRLATATLFPAFARTASVMAAKPFAKPLGIDEATIPAPVRAFLDDVDLYGTDLQPYVADIFLACMLTGLAGVLVDYPPAADVRTRADEQIAGTRPYFTTYPAASILGWKARRSAAGSYLTQLRLEENISEPDGEFGEKTIKQVRVLTPGAWQVWRKSRDVTGREVWAVWLDGTTTLDKVPFVFFYGLRKDFGIGAPPLLDLAHLNVEHWQSASDQQTILHVARVPILFAKGFDETDKLIIGASTAATSSNADSDLRYVEHTGAAIGAGRQSILDLEDRMRQTGAELLVQRPMTTTATQVVSETEGSRSTLQKIVEDFEESLEDCINLMGEWIGQPTDAEVHMFKDFGAANMSDKTGDLLLRARDSGVVSRETAFTELRRMDVISTDIQWADEAKRIASDPPPDQVTVIEKG